MTRTLRHNVVIPTCRHNVTITFATIVRCAGRPPPVMTKPSAPHTTPILLLRCFVEHSPQILPLQMPTTTITITRPSFHSRVSTTMTRMTTASAVLHRSGNVPGYKCAPPLHRHPFCWTSRNPTAMQRYNNHHIIWHSTQQQPVHKHVIATTITTHKPCVCVCVLCVNDNSIYTPSFTLDNTQF